MLTVDYENNALAIVAYTSFACAATALAYSVYTVVIYAPGFRERTVALLNKNKITARMLRDWDFRTIVTAIISFVMSIAYSVFNGVLGVTLSSIWYGALATYYIILALMRGGLLLYHKTRKNFESEAYVRAKNYGRCGYLLLILNAALSSAIAQMIFDDRRFEYKGWFVFAFAAYAFYKVIMSVINAVKAHKNADMTIMAIREINLIDAAVSILALQTALLHTFATDGTTDISLFNTFTGIAVSVFSFGISIYMILHARKVKKELKQNNE